MNTRQKKILLACCACLLAVTQAAMAEPAKWLTLRNGLAGLSVSDIQRDDAGLMWIATSNGITLYNGTSMKNYTLPPTSRGLPSYCYDIDTDPDGNVWAATKSGLYRLLRYQDHFQHVLPQITMAETVLCMGDTLFFGNREGLFCITDKGDGQLMPVSITGGTVVDNNSVRCLRLWHDRLWLTMREHLCEVDPQGKLPPRLHPLPQPSGLSIFDICAGKFFVGSKNNGLFVYHPDTHDIHHVDGVPNVITDVRACGDTAVCIATDGGGALLIDARSESVIQHFGTKEEGRLHLPSDATYCYYRSPEGINWIGMFQNGLVHNFHEEPVFSTYSCGTFSTQGITITGGYAYDNERLLATYGGFWLVNEATGQHRFFSTESMGIRTVKNFCRHGDYYYIGSYDGGLLRLHATQHTLSRVEGAPELAFATIHRFATDPKGQLWVATGEGLFRINGQSVRRYTDKNSRLPIAINSIVFDQKGNGWIGSSSGLCRYLAKEDVFKADGFPDDFFHRQPGLKVNGTGDTLLAWTQTKVYYTLSTLEQYGERDIPPYVLTERCFDAMTDQNGTLWMVTEKGLFSFGKDGGPAIHYTPAMGLHGNSIMSGTLGQDEQHVWVGTEEGLMVADKKRLQLYQSSQQPPRLAIDNLYLGGYPKSHGEVLRVNEERLIRVPWNFTIPKVALMLIIPDYSEHLNDICQYRIDDQPWTGHPLDMVLQIEGLSPGTHVLALRQAGQGTVSYELKVLPTLWFYAEMTLLIAALALLWWWYLWRRKTKILLREHVETEEALIEEMARSPYPASEEEPAEQMPERKTASANTEGTEGAKYQKVRMKEEELATLFHRMDDYVQQHKTYLNSDSKMSDIAAALGVSPSLLSQVFSLHVGEPYYDYINKYRLEAFKQLIGEGRHKQFTITALYEQCGFKKTSFFSTFRKVEGMTPTEWIQRQKG